MTITIVGLGPGDSGHVTRAAWEVLSQAREIFLRTDRHPAVAGLPAVPRLHSFDHVYEEADSFELVYATIVEELLAHANRGDVVYAVPGHPYVGESTVTALVAAARDRGLPVRVVAGLSFVEPTLAALGLDALSGLQIMDALEVGRSLYPQVNSDLPLLLGQVYNRLVAGEIKLTLGSVYPDEHGVYLIHGAGLPGEIVESLPLYAIDRSEQIGHLTSLYLPPLPVKSTLPALAETVAVLRSPQGCPWDREQTPQSLRAGFLEEAYEAVEAIDTGDVANLREELGDIVYHVVIQAQMAAEAGDFTLSDVIAGIETKLRRRHPHVWGDWQVEDTAQVLRNWDLLKQQEKSSGARQGAGSQPASLLDSVPAALPALSASQKIQSRAGRAGFDWPDIGGVFEKVVEELDEIRGADSDEARQAEVGDLLFIVVNLARWLGVEAEAALRGANRRFSERFRWVEEEIARRGVSWQALDFAAMDALWEEAKRQLANPEADDTVRTEG
jgi:tetrapyrrole methylase family protein/MazG family protein